MSGTEWFCGVQLGGVKLPAEFPAARNSKSMVHAGTGRWRQKNGRPMLIVGSRPAVYRMAVLQPLTKNAQTIIIFSHTIYFCNKRGGIWTSAILPVEDSRAQ